MKTAKEWVAEMNCVGSGYWGGAGFHKFIQDVQLEAYKAGLQESALIACSDDDYGVAGIEKDIHDAILIAMNEKKVLL